MVNLKQRGFTLIELVVVIVILGILSAFAVPRFMGLETQARAASVQALEGSVRSAASLAHSVWLANGATANTITVEGTAINMIRGYPTRASIDDTLQNISGFTYTQGNGVFARQGAAAAATCRVQYTPPAVLGEAPTILAPTAGC